MSEFWAQAAALVWGPITVVLLVGTGIYLSFRLKFTHLRHFKLGWRFAAQGNEVRARTQEEGSPPPSAIAEVKTVWDYADTMNGLQIFPNLIALIVLAPKVAEATRNYFTPATSK